MKEHRLKDDRFRRPAGIRKTELALATTKPVFSLSYELNVAHMLEHTINPRGKSPAGLGHSETTSSTPLFLGSGILIHRTPAPNEALSSVNSTFRAFKATSNRSSFT